jgi:serine/threonine protein kinase/tetratricopeptide (TPR) repeat protein
MSEPLDGPGHSLSADLADLVRHCGTLPLPRLAEALHEDQIARWRAGQRPPAEAYLEAFPTLADSADDVLVLVWGEVLLRLERGEALDPREYQARFPQHADALAVQFDLQRRLAGLPQSVVTSGHEPAGSAGPPVPEVPGDEVRGELGRSGMTLVGQTDDLPPGRSGALQQDPAHEFAPGTLLENRYLLERVLGQGGMGQVYLGRDSVLERPVAIKVIRPLDPHLRDRSLYDAALREAFVEEARIGANLTHPGIATVFDFGFHQAEPFIVFEYIAGETLGEVIRRRGRLPLEEVRLILGPLAGALDFAHSRHIVHRDLKPENVRATAQGHFKILDLGLAKEFRQQADWRFAGTPAYASPEQAAGLACDGRTDQYALALIAHEMLTGHWLFEHTDRRQLLRMHREQEPMSPRRFVPDLPESVCTALLRAFQKDSNRRFASCGEFAVACGCQLLNAPVPLPEILRLTAVSRMWGDWNSARFRAIRQGTAVYLVLSQDSLWVAYRGEIRCWPLRALTEVRRNWWGDELHLRFHRAGQVVPLAFRFASRQECQQWYEPLQDRNRQGNGDPSVPAEWLPAGPVVLMRRPPAMRYQTLGSVEFQDAKPRRAEVGLQVRAAMLGADAVVDVQEERLPQLGCTIHRRSGMAIKAVDSAGRCELRSRWFAGQISQLSHWMLLLIGVSFLCTLLGSGLLSLLDIGGIGIPLSAEETVSQRLAQVGLFIVLIHSWPCALTLLTRWLLWPQLLRPAGLAILALGAKPLAAPLGWLAAGVLQGQWVGGTVFLLALLDPINLAILLFAVFLCRRAWRASGEYRHLAADAEQAIPATRRAGGHLALATSVLYLLLLGGFLVWGQYSYVSHFVFPGTVSWKEKQALQHFGDGLAQLNRNPQAAEKAFRSALSLWQELTDAVPARPEYRHNLAATYQNLGLVLLRRGQFEQAEEAYRQALTCYDQLGADFPAYQKHGNDRASAQQSLTQLRAARPFQEDTAQMQEGQRLGAAGQHRAVLALYRQALARHEQQRNEFPDQANYLGLLASKQNRLAWCLVLCPDKQLRDPKQALELAGRAAETAPQEGAFWNTLGAAHFRAGNWKESLMALEKSMHLRHGGDGFDWLFLSMIHHRLGRTEEANKWLDKATDWIAQREQRKFPDPLSRLQWQSKRKEAEMLRQEAEALIRPKPEGGK